ncbi:efflux transporter outer membrane subunit [Kingella kingae]|uniref:efflux transporter outer membrane subunit n=3 Tax=Kingella kingae TaxID=504 RepID=UPI00254DBBC5|nr:efflux transporter outer membrane subunit [Kingella kingae]MDK4546526.1 efflux transporter outer membrane subunit [Kingella kingae]MDK4622350.1 efflux transporter outer membrane subunit [Kingella kingae]
MKKYIVYSMAMWLAACASFGEQTPLAQPVSGEQLNLPNQAIAPISPTWWQAYQDAQLNRLIEQALQQSPDLQMVAARIRQAQAAHGLAQSQQGVQAALKANGAGLLHYSPDDKTAPIPAAVQDAIGHDIAYGSLQLNAQWTWDLWGKQKAQTAAALGQVQARQYEWAAARLAIAQAVAQHYWQWQTLRQQASYIEQRIAIKQKQESLLQQRIRVGLMPASQAYPIAAAKRQLQAALRQMQQRAEQTLHALAALSGKTPNDLPTLQASHLASVPTLPSDTLTADLLGKRPDIAAQREAILARNQLIKAARADFYPNIRISALAGLSELKIGNLPTSANLMAGLLPSVSLPIFTSGALQANLAQKHAEFDEQVAQYNQTVYQSLRQAADVLVAYEQSAQAYRLQQESTAIAQRAAQAATRRHRAGLDNGLNQLAAQDEVLVAQSQQLDAQAQQNAAWINTNVVLGGGWLP